MTMNELNLDGLVGPTHHYAGLSFGNKASIDHALIHSNPKAAAKQGLNKMRLLHSLGVKQGLLPPHQRPNLPLLHQLGFTGSPVEQIQKAAQKAPHLLSACYSAASMWTANAATVSTSVDTNDHKVHFTAANIVRSLHRHQEADFSKKLLQRFFSDPDHFNHHPILPRSDAINDEGSANYIRLCQHHDHPGLHLFVYARQGISPDENEPKKYPARQTKEAFDAIVRNHQLDEKRVIFVRQNPKAIDQGVFHNDLICVANESLLFLHEEAFYNQAAVLKELRDKADFQLNVIECSKKRISIQDAVDSYLFNSQLITDPKNANNMILISTIECEQQAGIKSYLDELLDDNHNPIKAIHYLNLRQSMQNGGGPACLRLRLPLTQTELAAMHQEILLTETLLDQLEHWIDVHYRSELRPDDLADPQLLYESLTALDELTQILKLGSIYPFQQML